MRTQPQPIAAVDPSVGAQRSTRHRFGLTRLQAAAGAAPTADASGLRDMTAAVVIGDARRILYGLPLLTPPPTCRVVSGQRGGDSGVGRTDARAATCNATVVR